MITSTLPSDKVDTIMIKCHFETTIDGINNISIYFHVARMLHFSKILEISLSDHHLIEQFPSES